VAPCHKLDVLLAGTSISSGWSAMYAWSITKAPGWPPINGKLKM
jgi:hypothetical protein